MTAHDDATVEPVAKQSAGSLLGAPADPLGDAQRRWAEQLVEQAQAEGVRLVGPGGLLADVTKRVLELGLEVEMSEHLGYDRHDASGRNGGNSRNGTRAKTVVTDVGTVEIECHAIVTARSGR